MTETEAICALAPFLKEDREQNPKVVLAGDNKQLTYVPCSQSASLGGMTTDLMTRLMKSEVYKDERYTPSSQFQKWPTTDIFAQSHDLRKQDQLQNKTTSGKIVAVHTVSLTQRH